MNTVAGRRCCRNNKNVMKIIISNTVTLNGGDFAILESLIKILKRTYGEHIDCKVYDSHANVASKYYPYINYRTSLYTKYDRKSSTKINKRLTSFIKKFSLNRLILAARLFSKKQYRIANLLLSKEERIDFNNYASADLIISTGGTYLVENYFLDARFFDYYFTLALNKPLIFFTQSLGPFRKPANKEAIRKIFEKAALILLRDKASLNNLKDIGVNVSKARVCADVVFSDASSSELEVAKYSKTGTPLKVGISVRDWKFFTGRSQTEGIEKYYNSIAAISEYITIKNKGEIVFISTCQGIKEYRFDDSITAKNIYALLSDEAKQKTSVDSNFHTPDQLKAIFKNFDIVISTRMHGAIQALNVGVPVLPIAYEFKTKELFSKLINKDFILDIDTIEEKQAVKIFDQFLTCLPEFRAALFDKVIEEHMSALKPIQYLKEELKFL